MPSRLSQPGDIILGVRASIGDKVLSDGTYCLGRGVAGLRAKASLDTRYLWHWLTHTSHQLASKGRGATFKQVNREDIGGLRIPLVPHAEQRRIAEVLDRADELRAKRRQALAHLEDLTQSIFLNMFGDPIAEGKWTIVRCEELCTRVTVGVVVQPASYYRADGIPALRSLNIRPNEFVLDELVRFSREDSESRLSKSQVRKDDIVLVRTGRPGTAAVIPGHLDRANAIDILITTPNQELVDPTYLCFYFNSSAAQRAMLGEQRGQIQQHLNVSSLKKVPIPLPPLKAQHEFSAQAHHVDILRMAHLAQAAGLDGLFAALRDRAFAGLL
jgi:type I restriction enzyme S subunit